MTPEDPRGRRLNAGAGSALDAASASHGLIAYSPGVDGLRAIAVTAVVLYHAGLGGAGYAGVDVFFVISGYLITRLLQAEFERSGRISLTGFYARRAKRILPALVVMITLVLLVGWVLLSPGQSSQLANSAAWALGFLANVHFQDVTGSYFDSAAEQMPLLHLWSLSVEEQFYLAWPACILLALRASWRLPWVIAGLGLVSLGVAQFLMGTNPEAAFFQTPARMWELCCGALVAASAPLRMPRWTLPASLACLVAGLLVPIQPFPALGAVPVVLASTAAILALHSGLENRWLATRPMVAVGLVSYSWYLWHWPLLAINRATTVGEPALPVSLGLCLVALLLASVSHRYVELPFRRVRTEAGLVLGAGLLAAATVAIGSMALASSTLRGDPFPQASAAEADRPPLTCHTRTLDRPAPKCLPKTTTRVAIWGDSMAYAWTPSAWSADPDAVAFTRDACGPFLDYLPGKPSQSDRSCRQFNAAVDRSLGRVKTLVLVAWWRTDDERIPSLRKTLDSVAGRADTVLILGPSPTLRDEVPKCIRRSAQQACAISRQEFDQYAKPVLRRLQALAAEHPNVSVVDVSDVFCTRRECPIERDGRVLYWDSHHVAMGVARRFSLPAGTSAGNPGGR